MDQVVSKNIPWEKINVWCCDAFFPYGNIKQHQEEAHSDNVKPMKLSFICGIYEKSFSRQGTARIHERIHKSQFTCNFCKTGFRQKSFLKKHKKVCQSSVSTYRIGRERTAKKTKEAASRHDTNEDSDTVEISVISDAKTIVKKVNAIKKDVNGDAYIVLEDNAVNKEKIKCSEDETDDNVKLRENPKEGKGEINDKEICIICGAAIASHNMSKHVKHVHTMKDVKNFSCEYCGKSFKVKNALSRHIALHTGQMNFSCLVCDMKFREKFEAKACENKHNGVFSHSCHLCEYKTNSKWTLNRHVNTHLNIKPYSCPACQFKSGTKADVRRHVRTQHETDGSIISQLEASYPHMYNASESDEGLRNDPLFQNLVPAKRKSKWKYQPSVKYPTIVSNSDNNSDQTWTD